MGTVQRFDNHAVDSKRGDGMFLPNLLSLDRSERQREALVFLTRELRKKNSGKVTRYIARFAAGLVHFIQSGCMAQRFFIGDTVVTASAFRDFFKKQDKMTAVIGVSGRSAGNFAKKISRYYRIGVGAAHPAGRFFCNTARTHVADPAADAAAAEGALRSLLVKT
jgi:hypothetical protein